MLRTGQAEIDPQGHPERIFAYGFDFAGFSVPDEPIPLPGGGELQFVKFESPRNLDIADGVIIPQGIFEDIEQRKSLFGPRTHVWVHRFSMLERERQVFNLLRSGKWVCFLVGRIKDEVTQGIHMEPISDTDLCKRIMNAFGVRRRQRYHLDVPLPVKVRDREFDRYIESYGSPTMVLEFPHEQPIERRVVVELGEGATGVVFDNQLFFLPFQVSERNGSTARAAAKAVSMAISQYRRNRVTVIPAWVDEVRFKSEEKLYIEINSLLEKVNRLESQLASWRDFKGTLTTTGAALRDRAVAILESVFEVEVELEENRNEAVVLDDHGEPCLMVQTESAAGEVEVEFIERAAALRQKRGLPQTFPVCLLINSQMSVKGVRQRTESKVPEPIIQRARDRGVLVVRTVDLLFLTQHLESDPHRNDRLMRLLLSGGGWLKADSEEFGVCQG